METRNPDCIKNHLEDALATRRRLSRQIHNAKLASREDLESRLYTLVERAIMDHDPTVRLASVRIAARLTSIIASQITTQTQTIQRSLLTLEEDISEYGTEFVSQLVKEAQKTKDKQVGRFAADLPAAPIPANAPAPVMQLADDWAGPVAGPTTIERYYGIPRSTLYRWQKFNEAIALNTRTSSKPVFPLRQFVDGRPATGVAELIAIFGDGRKAWQWLIASNSELAGQAPIDPLLEGRVSIVLEFARRECRNLSSRTGTSVPE